MSPQDLINAQIEALKKEAIEVERQLAHYQARKTAIPHVGSALLKLLEDLKAQPVSSPDEP